MSKPHRKSGVKFSSRSPRTQINLGGAPAGNQNAKKSLQWLDSFDLSTPEGVRGFLQQVVKHTWTGDLGTRAASALNGTISLLLDHEVLPMLEKRLKALEEAKE